MSSVSTLNPFHSIFKESVSSQNAYGLLNDCIYVIKNIKKPLSGTFRKTFSKDESKESPSLRIMSTIANQKKKYSSNSRIDSLMQLFITVFQRIHIQNDCKTFGFLSKNFANPLTLWQYVELMPEIWNLFVAVTQPLSSASTWPQTTKKWSSI